jgi:predicted transposase YdaD
VRLWQENPEDYLTAEVGLVPLAPLTDVTETDLPEVVRRMAGRINVEPRPRAAKLWTATYLLMGVRYPDDMVNQLLEGIHTMRESSTYQAILREGRQEGRQEGRVEGEQKLLIRMGTKRFGKPSAATVAAIEAERDIDRLENLGERILDPGIRDWDELLRTP